MPEASYASATLIRSVDDMIARGYPSSVPNDAILEGLGLNFSNPIINAALLRAGFAMPILTGTIPPFLASVCADLAAARIFAGYTAGFTGKDPEKATTLRDNALDTLKKIADHEFEIDFPRSETGAAVVFDETPWVKPDEMTHVGEPINWRRRAAYRESDDDGGEEYED